MGRVTMNDVRTRLKWLQRKSNTSRMHLERAQLDECMRASDIKRFIEGCYKNNSDVDFYVYCNLLENAAKVCTASELRSIGDYICENMVHRVRSAKDTNTLIKQRLTRLQNKMKPAISNGLENITTSMDPSNFGVAGNTSVSSNSASSDNNKEVLEEIYTSMLDKISNVMNCDRMLENYNRISKRFNIDKLFIDSKLDNDDIVISVCEMVDTYDMPTDIKFNTVIESALYGFESNSKPYSKKDILRVAIEYFLFKQDGLQSCRSILEATMFYDKNDDMGDIDILTEEEPEEDLSIGESIMSSVSTSTMEVVNESAEFSDILNKFKKEQLGKDNKPQNKLRSLIDSLYRKDVNSIIDDTPDLLKWFRKFFILGAFAIPAIGPVVGCIGYIADKFIAMHYDREQLPKVIKCFNKELKECRARLKELDNEEDKEKLNKYIKSLEEARNKINNYYTELLNDEEQDKYYENLNFDDGSGDDDDDFDFGFDDFLENSIFTDLKNSMELYIETCNSNIINAKSMMELAKRLDESDISTLSKIVSRYPTIFFKESVVDGFQDTLSKLRTGKLECANSVARSMRICAYSSALDRLNNPTYDVYKLDEASMDNIDRIREFEAIQECYSAIAIMIETYSNCGSMLEASYTNNLTAASTKLRSSLNKMSDKERAVSRTLDMGMNNFKKGVEVALTNDNRESIIKGSVLPSFSKIIKLCIANAALVALGQPAIAAIGTLAYLGMSSKFKAKERQMVIDEIEIELKMCNEYIDIAKSKNDTVALRQLYTTERELNRQLQRIKYKMRIDFGQKYYDAKSPN